MRICLLTDAPDHPLLAAATALLTPDHRVDFLDPNPGSGPPSALVDPDDLADVYLLKAHTPRALALAYFLEGHGARVVNSASATELCQDRTRMAEVAGRAGLPFPGTRTLASLADLTDLTDQTDLTDLVTEGTGPDYPFMVKSRHNRRGDLVARVDDPARLRAVAAEWPGEPVVVQEFVANSGWDHKLWVIAGEVFSALRPAKVGAPRSGAMPEPVVRELPSAWTDLVLQVGPAFDLDVYGVDLLDRAGAPVIVDINAFPGIRGPVGAPEALAALALRAPTATPAPPVHGRGVPTGG